MPQSFDLVTLLANEMSQRAVAQNVQFSQEWQSFFVKHDEGLPGSFQGGYDLVLFALGQ